MRKGAGEACLCGRIRGGSGLNFNISRRETNISRLEMNISRREILKFGGICQLIQPVFLSLFPTKLLFLVSSKPKT